MTEIEDDIYNNIVKLTNQGEAFFDAEDYKSAIKKYNEAFELIPKPYHIYEASSWVLAAIGDTYFLMKNYKEALATLKHAEACAGGLNPFIWFRIGQCYCEFHEIENAREYLIMAYAMEGEEIFENESPKYLKLISDLVEGVVSFF